MKGQHRIIRVTGGKVALMNTSRLSDAKVIAAIRFVAKEVDVDRVVVHVKKMGSGRSSYGRAYKRIPSIANMSGLNRWDWKYLVTVTDIDFILTLAHECKHVEQFRERKPISEVACYAFEGWVLDRWQESHRKTA